MLCADQPLQLLDRGELKLASLLFRIDWENGPFLNDTDDEMYYDAFLRGPLGWARSTCTAR